MFADTSIISSCRTNSVSIQPFTKVTHQAVPKVCKDSWRVAISFKTMDYTTALCSNATVTHSAIFDEHLLTHAVYLLHWCKQGCTHSMHLLQISPSGSAMACTFIVPTLVACTSKLARSAQLYGEIRLNILDAPLPFRAHWHGDEAADGHEYCWQRYQMWSQSRHVLL